MKKNILFLSILLLFIISIVSCTSCNNDHGETVDETDIYINFDETEFLSKITESDIAAINNIVGGFSSPIEMAALIKDSHIPYSKKYLVSTQKIDDYDTELKKALGLGILSADLGYLNIYEKNSSMIKFLLSLNGLARDLQVSQYFDFQTLKRLVTSSDNVDSLIYLSVSSYNQIDAHFRDTQRSHLSVASVTGVWIENLYLMTQVAKDNPQKSFSEQIGSQKDLFIELYQVIKVYEGHPKFDYILKEFKKLFELYQDVTISIKKVKGRVEIVDGSLTIYPDEETVVEISEETAQKIIKTTEVVRNNIVNIR